MVSAAMTAFPFRAYLLSCDDQLHAHVVVPASTLNRTLDEILSGSLRCLYVVIAGTVIQPQIPTLVPEGTDHEAVGRAVSGLFSPTLRRNTKPQQLSWFGTYDRRLFVQDT